MASAASLELEVAAVMAEEVMVESESEAEDLGYTGYKASMTRT